MAMKFILILILLNFETGYVSSEMGTFGTMDACFDARDKLVEKIGRPIFNYQAICVIRNQ